MYKTNLWILIVISIILFIGCASFNQPPNQNNVLSRVCQIMDKPMPKTSPKIWVVESPLKLAELCNKVDKTSLKNLKQGYVPVGACIIGDIFLLKSALSESTMAHEMAHYLGANEQEAEIISSHFSHALVFRSRYPDNEWGSFAMNR